MQKPKKGSWRCGGYLGNQSSVIMTVNPWAPRGHVPAMLEQLQNKKEMRMVTCNPAVWVKRFVGSGSPSIG